MIMMTEMFSRIEAKPNDQLKAEDMKFAVSTALWTSSVRCHPAYAWFVQRYIWNGFAIQFSAQQGFLDRLDLRYMFPGMH